MSWHEGVATGDRLSSNAIPDNSYSCNTLLVQQEGDEGMIAEDVMVAIAVVIVCMVIALAYAMGWLDHDC